MFKHRTGSMQRRRPIEHHTAVLALALGALAACGGTRADVGGTDGVDTVPIGAPPPWTNEFAVPSTLIADAIYVEGPAGIREHCAARQDPGSVDYDLSTEQRGLVQTFAMQPGAESTHVSGWLDAWEMFAWERIVIVERPSRGGDVIVRAVGSVVFKGPDGEANSASFERRARTGP